MRNKVYRRCKKCKSIFNAAYNYYEFPPDIRYYVLQKNRKLCAYCIIKREYKKPLRNHDWRVSIAAHTEYWYGVR